MAMSIKLSTIIPVYNVKAYVGECLASVFDTTASMDDFEVIVVNGGYKAAVWHSYACIKTMKRRGIEDESLMLFPIEYALKKAYDQGYKIATSSRFYQIGKVLVYPLLFWSRLWKK